MRIVVTPQVGIQVAVLVNTESEATRIMFALGGADLGDNPVPVFEKIVAELGFGEIVECVHVITRS